MLTRRVGDEFGVALLEEPLPVRLGYGGALQIATAFNDLLERGSKEALKRAAGRESVLLMI